MDPGSPQGQLLAHVLDNEPQLFDAAVEATLDRLCDEIDDAESASNGVIDVTNDDGDGNAADRAAPKKGGELVLFPQDSRDARDWNAEAACRTSCTRRYSKSS